MKYLHIYVSGLVLMMAGAVNAQPFAVVSVSEQDQDGLRRTKFVVQNGSDPANRFGVERVVLSGELADFLTAPVILEPGLGTNSTIYTLGNAAGGADFQNSIAANLAHGGVDVYLYSPRETFLAPGQCAAPGSCAEAGSWGYNAFLSDLSFIRELVARDHVIKPVIGGYSLGGMVSLAAVSQDPTAYSGLIMGDSPQWDTDATARAGYQIICGGLAAALAAGQVVNDQLNPLAATLVELEQAAPNAPSPIPLFPPGTTNRQAYLAFFTAPQPGPPAGIFPAGTILTAGSVASNSLTYSSEPRLNTAVLDFNYYVSNAILHDSVCSFAGDTTYIGNLKAYRGPILSFQLDAGFGALANETIALTSSQDVDVVSLPGYGHFDLLSSANHATLLDQPIIRWVFGDTVFGSLR